jgi:hypothetical protein
LHRNSGKRLASCGSGAFAVNRHQDNQVKKMFGEIVELRQARRKMPLNQDIWKMVCTIVVNAVNLMAV